MTKTATLASVTFKPKQVVKKLLASLPDRSRTVLMGRYGLGNDPEPQTLEAIGEKFGITRERVRQIENHGLVSLKKSPAFKSLSPVFEELERLVHGLGGIVAEEELLAFFAKDQSARNHIRFLLVLGEPFQKHKEDEEFHHRWHVNPDIAEKVHATLRSLYQNLSDDELIPEAEMIKTFLQEVQDLNDQYKDAEIIRRWLSLSKQIGKNPLGEWGKASSPNVRAKGMRDYAYLAIKRHGSPMHFREVANLITELFGKRAHVATTHNELIKDKRFVLVGRGLYALSEWGYSNGVVREVIREIVKKSGPLTKNEIIDRVLKERYVKENTIVVNLQNSKYFKKNKEGKYTLP
jgi:hypothetical protein